MTFQMEDLKEFCKKTSLHGWRHLAMEDDSHQGSCQTIGETITNITLMNIYIYISFVPCILLGTLAIQRHKNLGSRVALLPGKILRVRKVFALITEKNL